MAQKAQGQQWLSVIIFTTGPDGAQVAEQATILVLSSASPPPRPQPPPGGGGGTEPPLVIWGPGDPRPTLPIAGWDPGTGAFPNPPGGGGGGGDGGGVPGLKPPTSTAPGVAVIRNATVDPGTGLTPPPDMPNATYSDVYYGPGAGVAKAWIGPYVQHHPGG